MPVDQIAKILRESPLDRETKLFAIDLITLTEDQTFIQRVMDLILEWKKTDMETVEALQQGLFELAEMYRTNVETLDQKQTRATLDIADQIKSAQQIQKIRQKLINAV